MRKKELKRDHVTVISVNSEVINNICFDSVFIEENLLVCFLSSKIHGKTEFFLF